MTRSLLDRLILPLAAMHAQRAFRGFMAAAAQTPLTQERVLAQWLRRHGASAFGRDHHLQRVQAYTEFARQAPIGNYEQFAPYIARVRQGETTALLHPRQRVLMFAMTSGTTAKPKYIPVTREFLRGYQRGWNAWGVKALLDHPGSFLRSIVQVSSPMNDQVAESGVPCGAITGLLAASQKRLVRKYYVAPLCIADITDSTAKYYAIMRLAIVRDVAFMVAANPQTLLQLARTANAQAESLIRDVHDGALSTAIPMAQSIRHALAARLRPMPDEARRLEQLIRSHGALRPRDYWKLSFLAHWTGGTMGLFRSQLSEWYGDLPVRDPGLLASEGRMSIPVDDNTSSGILDVTSQFFEFVPAAEYPAANEPDRLTRMQRASVRRSHELQAGHDYYLLLTNSAGLCRYDIGDCIRVTGHHHGAPLIAFLNKGAHASSLTGEKLTESHVMHALGVMPVEWRMLLVSCVLAPRFDTPPYYALWADDAVAPGLRPEMAARLDAGLCDANMEYASRRKTDRLGPVRFISAATGFLWQRDQELRGSSSSRAEQFKHQYLLGAPGQDEAWPMTPP